MSNVKFNHLTKEVEMTGSESFIESNFNKIQDLLVEKFGDKSKMAVSRRTNVNQKPESAPSPIPAITLELEGNRQPLRKYIRKVGIPGNQRIVVEVAEQNPAGISLASLKEKFGLSESKIAEIIRDAEKFGKVRKVMNGSYVLTED